MPYVMRYEGAVPLNLRDGKTYRFGDTLIVDSERRKKNLTEAGFRCISEEVLKDEENNQTAKSKKSAAEKLKMLDNLTTKASLSETKTN